MFIKKKGGGVTFELIDRNILIPFTTGALSGFVKAMKGNIINHVWTFKNFNLQQRDCDF